MQLGVFDVIPRFQQDIQGMPVGENSLSGMLTRIDPFLNGSCRPNSNSSVEKKETKDNGNAGLFAAGVMAWDTSDKKTQNLNLGVLAIYRASNLGVGCSDS